MLPCQGGIKNLISLVLKRKEETWIRYDAMVVMDLGTIERIGQNLIRTRGKRNKPILSKKGKNLLKEEVKDLYYD